MGDDDENDYVLSRGSDKLTKGVLALQQLTLMVVNHPDSLVRLVVALNWAEDDWKAQGQVSVWPTRTQVGSAVNCLSVCVLHPGLCHVPAIYCTDGSTGGASIYPVRLHAC